MVATKPEDLAAQTNTLKEIFESVYLACTTPTKRSGGSTYIPDVIISNPPVAVHTHTGLFLCFFFSFFFFFFFFFLFFFFFFSLLFSSFLFFSLLFFSFSLIFFLYSRKAPNSSPNYVHNALVHYKGLPPSFRLLWPHEDD